MRALFFPSATAALFSRHLAKFYTLLPEFRCDGFHATSSSMHITSFCGSTCTTGGPVDDKVEIGELKGAWIEGGTALIL